MMTPKPLTRPARNGRREAGSSVDETTLPAVAVLFGAALIIIGVAMWSTAAALIVAGVAVIAAAAAYLRGGDKA